VVRDFHHQPLHRAIEPLVLLLAPNPYWMGEIQLKLRAEDHKPVLGALENRWKELAPGYSFDYRFLRDDFERFYRRENQMKTLVSWSAGLTLIIACLGLFGLVAILAEKRLREICIRKVLGASPGRLVALLCQDFLLLVTGANIVAWPLAWWAAERWLSGFSSRVPVRIEWFLGAGLFSLMVALMTVAGRAMNAARRNPVDILNSE
jgi:putative ABC transport system permease protein